MPEIELSQLYSNMQNEMLRTLQSGAAAFMHPGTKGDTTEANWAGWFRSYLPKRYAIDKAIIIDATGKCSDQIDLVIYDAQYSHLVFEQQGYKLIPAESIYAVFEVKQNLGKAHMEYAQSKAESVRSLSRSSAPIAHAGGDFPPKPLHEILAGILTTSSDWATPINSNVYANANITNHNKRLDFVCSISDGAFVFDNNIFVKDYDLMQLPCMRFCESNNSLVFFLLNLLDRLQRIGTVPAIDYTRYAAAVHYTLHKNT